MFNLHGSIFRSIIPDFTNLTVLFYNVFTFRTGHFVNPSTSTYSIPLTSRIGLQLSTEELMKTMPLRETVAGEALSMLCGSKTILQLGAMGIRSPLASVSVRLSSSTEFRFSIQMASTGPSRTIQMCSPGMIIQGQIAKFS